MTVLAKNLRKNLYAREAGSNKQLASRACCLSLVRQLFHAGEIEPYTGEKRKKKHTEVAAYNVILNSKVEENLTRVLDNLGLPVNSKPPTNLPPDQTYNMITNYNLVDFDDAPKQKPQLIAWCPPLANWNPWTACNIDEGPEATQPLSHISANLASEWLRRLDNDPQLRALMDERSQLPVNLYKVPILEAVKRDRVTIIRGETGCGKTTQIPQFILDSYLESGRGAECSILVTQPRRISAISLAERIAYERGETVGTSIGYCVRFETVYPRPYGSILFCTVGTMARKMEGGLRGVSHVIVDEIHERDVNTDFMLILLREMIRVNKNLRLILMSATIDISMFSDYFGDCTILDIEGRTHPVEYYFLEDCVKMVNFVPPPPDEKKRKRRQEVESVSDNNEDNCNLMCDPVYGDAVIRTMKEITEKEVPFELVGALLDKIINMSIPGAVLVFLPGWNIISLLRKYLQSHPRYGGPDYYILPLHSQIPREDQRLVFRSTPPGVRKIVLATNIAESSITINDVVFVIDFCLSRTKLFTARNNLTSYSTSWASKTNLEQRRGRAGRVRPGFAFHLCSRARFERLDQHATPEILRTPLHELALLIKLLRLGSVRDFLMKALQPPPLDAVIEAEHTLKEMKALDANDELTPLGFILARLPIEPRLGKMLIFACAFNLGGAAAVLTSVASLGCDPFLLPPDHRRLSNHQRSFAAGYSSDHLAGLNVFQVWASERARLGDESADLFCEQHGFNSSALRIIDDAANQLRTILINLGFPEDSLSDAPINFNVKHNIDCDVVSTLLVSGLYPNICYHSEKRRLLTIEGTLALIHKGSVNCVKDMKFTYPFFVFDEKIRTQAVSCKAAWRNDDSGEEGTIIIDDWIPFRMNYISAARIFAFRPALEALLVRTCLRPEGVADLREEDQRVIDVLHVTLTIIDNSLNDDELLPLLYLHLKNKTKLPSLTELKFTKNPDERIINHGKGNSLHQPLNHIRIYTEDDNDNNDENYSRTQYIKLICQVESVYQHHSIHLICPLMEIRCFENCKRICQLTECKNIPSMQQINCFESTKIIVKSNQTTLYNVQQSIYSKTLTFYINKYDKNITGSWYCIHAGKTSKHQAIKAKLHMKLKNFTQFTHRSINRDRNPLISLSPVSILNQNREYDLIKRNDDCNLSSDIIRRRKRSKLLLSFFQSESKFIIMIILVLLVSSITVNLLCSNKFLLTLCSPCKKIFIERRVPLLTDGNISVQHTITIPQNMVPSLEFTSKIFSSHLLNETSFQEVGNQVNEIKSSHNIVNICDNHPVNQNKNMSQIQLTTVKEVFLHYKMCPKCLVQYSSGCETCSAQHNFH
ncbi:unnamed protein product [Heterobilharzia americana]|nr:unnamed protein product [Heterobilharzia americana]